MANSLSQRVGLRLGHFRRRRLCTRSADLSAETVASYGAVPIATEDDALDDATITDTARLVVETCQALADRARRGLWRTGQSMCSA